MYTGNWFQVRFFQIKAKNRTESDFQTLDSAPTPSPVCLGYANPIPQVTCPTPPARPPPLPQEGQCPAQSPSPGYANPAPQFSPPAPHACPRPVPSAQFTPPTLPCLCALPLCAHAKGAGGWGGCAQGGGSHARGEGTWNEGWCNPHHHHGVPTCTQRACK